MDEEELNFVNQILSGNNGYLESSLEHRTLQEIDEKREEALYYLYENYLDSDDNKYNLNLYLESMNEYEYVEDITDLNNGDYIRYPILDDLSDIKMHSGAYIATMTPTSKYGNKLEHLLLLKAPRPTETAFGFKKDIHWNINKDSIIFRKLTQNDKLNASIAELLDDLDLN